MKKNISKGGKLTDHKKNSGKNNVMPAFNLLRFTGTS
jgi:hypothetical protein